MKNEEKYHVNHAYLQKRRADIGYTQANVAIMSGYSVETISQLEKDPTEINAKYPTVSWETLQELVGILDCTVGDIICEDDKTSLIERHGESILKAKYPVSFDPYKKAVDSLTKRLKKALRDKDPIFKEIVTLYEFLELDAEKRRNVIMYIDALTIFDKRKATQAEIYKAQIRKLLCKIADLESQVESLQSSKKQK